ncbi:MAG TPA: hypothetical protein VGD04_10910 [Methylophilus sp.]
MTMTYEFIQIAKAKNKLTSDYAVAKLLGVTPQKLSNWKKGESEANSTHTLKILQLAGISVDDALRRIEGGFASVSLLTVTGITATALTYWNSIAASLYIMLN